MGMAIVDDRQRHTLELEVKNHRARIVEIESILHDLEERLDQASGTPAELALEAELLRMELQGRRAAFSVGSAHLEAHAPA